MHELWQYERLQLNIGEKQSGSGSPVNQSLFSRRDVTVAVFYAGSVCAQAVR